MKASLFAFAVLAGSAAAEMCAPCTQLLAAAAPCKSQGPSSIPTSKTDAELALAKIVTCVCTKDILTLVPGCQACQAPTDPEKAKFLYGIINIGVSACNKAGQMGIGDGGQVPTAGAGAAAPGAVPGAVPGATGEGAAGGAALMPGAGAAAGAGVGAYPGSAGGAGAAAGAPGLAAAPTVPAALPSGSAGSAVASGLSSAASALSTAAASVSASVASAASSAPASTASGEKKSAAAVGASANSGFAVIAAVFGFLAAL